MKIVLIGPVYPYKGGIAHYTGMLFRTLEKKHEVSMISYKLQYPRFLFRKQQKDFSSDLFKVEPCKYLINTMNPFNIVRVGQKIKKIEPDLVIIQWWHPYFAPCYRLLEISIGKKIQKMFICHNVFPHERFPMDRFLTKLVLKHGDSFIVHSESDAEDLLTIKPKAKYKNNPHPTYNMFRIKNMSKDQAREELGISESEKVLLFFGFVREYKGLKYLLRAMPMIRSKMSDVRLMVVGTFGEDKEDYIEIINECQIRECVDIIDGYTPDNEVEKYFTACDLVVCPYESATQSGIVQIAYGFEKPVIATNVGGLPDVVTDGKTGFIIEPRNSGALAEAVEKYYRENQEAVFAECVKEEAYRFSWDRMVEAIMSLGKDGSSNK